MIPKNQLAKDIYYWLAFNRSKLSFSEFYAVEAAMITIETHAMRTAPPVSVEPIENKEKENAQS